jgi:hypothetical protein
MYFAFVYTERGDSLSRREEFEYIFKLCNNLPGCFDLSGIVLDKSFIVDTDVFYRHYVEYWVPVTDLMYYWETADSTQAILERDSLLYPDRFYCGPSILLCQWE